MSSTTLAIPAALPAAASKPPSIGSNGKKPPIFLGVRIRRPLLVVRLFVRLFAIFRKYLRIQPYIYSFSEMDFVKQPTSLPVNSVLSGQSEEITQRHGKLLPDSIRCIICGPSNCGKTNAMLNLLVHPEGLRFANCYVYSKSLQQPKYQFLQQVLDGIKGVGSFFYNDREDVVKPTQVKPDSVMVFDDVAVEKQDVIRDYFSMGRHAGVDSFYLCQSYTHIPKHLIRDNANFIIVFKQDDLNTQHIYNDHVNTDMSLDKFREMCGRCWETNKYSPLVVNKDCSLQEGRYRRGFDEYIQLWKTF
jgi:hypothetical protein